MSLFYCPNVCISMLKEHETDSFSIFFSTLLEFGRIFLQSFVLTPYLYPFSDFTLEEEVKAEEPTHWEAPPEGNLDSKVPREKELN